MPRPNWDEAPEWAQFAARDDDGDWNWFEKFPNYHHEHGYWATVEPTKFQFACKETLGSFFEMNPVKPKT